MFQVQKQKTITWKSVLYNGFFLALLEQNTTNSSCICLSDFEKDINSRLFFVDFEHFLWASYFVKFIKLSLKIQELFTSHLIPSMSFT